MHPPLPRRVLLAVAGLTLPRLAAAQDALSTRQVAIVVGVAPGGTADMAARILAEGYPAASATASPSW